MESVKLDVRHVQPGREGGSEGGFPEPVTPITETYRTVNTSQNCQQSPSGMRRDGIGRATYLLSFDFVCCLHEPSSRSRSHQHRTAGCVRV